MKLILKKAHAYLYKISVALFYFLMLPLLYLFSRKQTSYKYMNKLRRAWGFLSSACVGIFYRFTYEVPFDRTKPYIICPNHTSNLDISAMSALVKSDCSFMGKEELLEGIVTGLFFRTVDIPVNRESKMSSYRAFKKAMGKLAEGITIIIFPEGGIAEGYPPKLQEFKNGPFRLAIESGMPIVPVTMPDTWKVLWDTGTKHGSRPGICNIFVHKPIETAGMSVDEADVLKDRVYDIIKLKLDEYDHR
jgi:1-acyl-sn-glycerol-3-phosphate acyltransferase